MKGIKTLKYTNNNGDSRLKEVCGFGVKNSKSGHLLSLSYNHSGFIILTEVAD